MTSFFQLSRFPWHVFFQRGPADGDVKPAMPLLVAVRHPRGSSPVLQLLRKGQKLESKESGNLCFGDILQFAYRGKRLHKICLTHR